MICYPARSLRVLPAEEREGAEKGHMGEYAHPTARQYSVHAWGARIGTLIKWWIPSPCPGVPGSWVWTMHPWHAELCETDYDTLADAKRALRITR